MDWAHRQTDKMLFKLEKTISNHYTRLFTAMQFIFSQKYDPKDSLSETILNTKQYKDMETELARIVHDTNLLSAAEVRALFPKVYSFNANYAMYQIEQGAKISTAFNLVDEATVERLIRKNPELLPKYKPKSLKDVVWNRRKIHSCVLQGILKGETNKDIAQLFQTVVGMNKSSAIRNARTATTAAECGGRVYSYEKAEEMGIELEQEWQATLDGRTRHEHRKLDGQSVPVGKSFTVDGYEIKYPGDPEAEPEMTYNCRCTLVANIKGIDNSRNERLTTMEQSYADWKQGKRVTYGESRDING